MSLRCSDFFASRTARGELRAARYFRDAAAVAGRFGASAQAVRAVRAEMRNHALIAVAEARRTRVLHSRAESEIGEYTPAA
jgi:hypothetical protein